MYKTLYIMRKTTYQLVQDVFHQQYSEPNNGRFVDFVKSLIAYKNQLYLHVYIFCKTDSGLYNDYLKIFEEMLKCNLPETNSQFAPEKLILVSDDFPFEGAFRPIFRGELAVSFSGVVYF